MFEHLAIALFTSKAIMFARVLAILGHLAPCPVGSAACLDLHRRVAQAVATVSAFDRDPEDAAARLLGACLHETRCAAERQVHGPAVTPWQLEGTHAQRDLWLADDVGAALTALRRTRTCRGGDDFRAYATGRCKGGGQRGAQKAAELRASYRHVQHELSKW